MYNVTASQKDYRRKFHFPKSKFQTVTNEHAVMKGGTKLNAQFVLRLSNTTTKADEKLPHQMETGYT